MYPVLFHLGTLPVRAYGFMVFVGFALGLLYTRTMARRKMGGRSPDTVGVITPDHVTRFCVRALWVGILGGRLLYVALDWKSYRGRPQELFNIWEGGMTAYGAILFGLGYLWYYCRRHRLSFLGFADLIAPTIALVYAVGRIGCFLNGCCFGAPWDHPWAVSFIRDGHTDLGNTVPSHPAQLYSSAMNFAMFAFLHYRSRRSHNSGEVFATYLVLFCLYRTAYEYLRAGASSEVLFSGLTHAQVFNLALLPFALLLLWRIRKGPNDRPESMQDPSYLNTRTPEHLNA